MDLPSKHYAEAMDHESAIVAACLIDRKALRLVEDLSEDMFVDPSYAKIFKRLQQDPFTELADLFEGTEEHMVRTVTDRIRSPITGAPRYFHWNFGWHKAELQRLQSVRKEFRQATKVIMQFGDPETFNPLALNVG